MKTQEIKTQIKKTLSRRPAHWTTMYPGDKNLYVMDDLGFCEDDAEDAIRAIDRLPGRVAEILIRCGAIIVADGETGDEFDLRGLGKTRRAAIAELKEMVKNEIRPEFEFYKTPAGRVVRL